MSTTYYEDLCGRKANSNWRNEMQVGDIVTIYDGSYNMFYDGNGELGSVNGMSLRGREFRVLLIQNGMPTYVPEPLIFKGTSSNSLMLCEVNAPEHILFTRSHFCRVVRRTKQPTEVPKEVEIAIPPFTKSIVFRLVK
jgi:hypothetical protein